MEILLKLLCVTMIFIAVGCGENEQTVNLRRGVKNESLTNNVIVSPIAFACSALLGEGIAVDEALKTNNDKGILELYVKGHNNSRFTKRFWYRPEWIDKNGMTIPSRTGVWIPMSVTGKSKYTFKVVAPTEQAVDVKIDTKKWE